MVRRLVFRDRADAGRRLGAHLEDRDWGDAIVAGLPRGGVPVASEVAKALGLPLDVLVVRKLGYPGHPELAIGAIGEQGVHVVNEDLLRRYPVPLGALESVERRERVELDRRIAVYRGSAAPLDVTGRTAILIDDGIATGSTMLAAIEVVRCLDAATVVVATPVAAPEAVQRLERRADEVIALAAPRAMGAVGLHYDDFTQTDDHTVARLLHEHPIGDRGSRTGP